MIVNQRIYNSETFDRLAGGFSQMMDEILVVEDDYNDDEIRMLIRDRIHNKETNKIRLINVVDSNTMEIAKIRQDLNIPGMNPEEISKFSDKAVFKKTLIENSFDGIPKSHVKTLAEIEEDLEKFIKDTEKRIPYPIFTKPAVSSGSEGCFRNDNRRDFRRSIDYYCSKKLEFLCEELLEGIHGFVECLIVDNQIVWLYTTKCVKDFYNSMIVNCEPYAYIVVPEEDEFYSEVLDYARRLYKALYPVPDGYYCSEFWKKNDKIYVQEVNPRQSGGNTTSEVFRQFGICGLSTRIDLLCGFPIRVPRCKGISNNSSSKGKQLYMATLIYPIFELLDKKVKRNYNFPKTKNQCQYEIEYITKDKELFTLEDDYHTDGDYAYCYLYGKIYEELMQDLLEWYTFRPLVEMNETKEMIL